MIDVGEVFPLTDFALCATDSQRCARNKNFIPRGKLDMYDI